MIKDILVCLEASPSAEFATQTALEIAQEQGATMTGLAIVDEPDIRAGTAVGIGGAAFKHERDEVLVADAHKQAADWLAMFERKCRKANVPAKVLEVVGRPAASIVAEADKHDLAVIGRDANFKFETEATDPQTIDTILQKASGPVLLVPQGAPARIGKKVVVAYDGSNAAKRAIASFAASGLAAGRDVRVATVDDDGAVAWEVATQAVEQLKEAGVAASLHNIVSLLSKAEALFSFAGEVGAGLMVMGAFAHSRLKNLFKTSVTRGLAEQTTIPLYMQH